MTPLTWQAQEHRHIERGSDWYWALGTIAASSAIISILFSNVLFALLIVLAAVTIGMIAARPPILADVELNERELIVHGVHYPHDEMFSFWVDDGDEPKLLIDTPRFMSPDLVVPLHGTDPEAVRAILRERVPERELHESLFLKILEFFGY